MPVEDYLLGFAFLAATLATAVAVAALLARKYLDHLRGAPRVCALSLLFLGAVLAAHLLPAIAGVLSRETVLATGLLLALAASLAPGGGTSAPEARAEPPPSARLSWAIAVAAGVAVLAQVLVFAVERGAVPVTAFDALSFHLPGVASWIDTGSLWQLDNFFPGYAVGNFPHNGDFLQLAAVLPWDNDAFVRLVEFPLLLLAAASVYALACELGAPRATATVFAAAVSSVPVMQLPALEEAQTDPLMFAAFGCGLLFLARHARTGARSELVLAGLGLGLAFGTKWYAVPYVAIALAVWAAAWLVARRRPRRLLRDGAILVGTIAMGGGIWLVRNLVESSNPLFPVKVELGGITIFDAPRDRIREEIGFGVVHYFDRPSVFADHIFPSWADTFQSPGLLLVSGALLALVTGFAAARQAGWSDPAARLFWCALLGFGLVGGYAITPNSALGPEGEPVFMGAAARYAVPALMVAAVAAAAAVGPLGRWRQVAELLALGATLDGLARVFDFSAGAAVAAVAAAAAAVAAAVVLRRRGIALPRTRGAGGAAIAAGLAALAVIAWAGDRLQEDFNDGRYLGQDPVIDYVLTQAPADQRIGLTGTWSDRGLQPTLPLFGPRLENHVEYVGRLGQGLLERHVRGDAFRADLRDGRYDLLLVGRGGPPPRLLREGRWAREAGFTPLVASERFELMRPGP